MGDRQHLLSLSTNPVLESSLVKWSRAAWHSLRDLATQPSHATRSPDNPVASISSLWASILEYPAMLGVFRNNNFDLGQDSQAVFRTISRLNHACVPNAQGNFNFATGSFAVHAVHEIGEGEEISISYLAEHAAPRSGRQSLLMQSYGFLCGCTICDPSTERGQLSEQRRTELHEKLGVYCEQEAQRTAGDVEAEMRMNLMAIEVYQAEGIAGRELATLCLATAKLAAELGDRRGRDHLTELGLRLEEDCVGLDNPAYNDSVEQVLRLKTQSSRDSESQ